MRGEENMETNIQNNLILSRIDSFAPCTQENKKKEVEYFALHKNKVTSILIWSEENLIISGSKDKILFWDFDGKLVFEFKDVKGEILNLKFIKRNDFLVKEEFCNLNQTIKNRFGKFSKIVNSVKMKQTFFLRNDKKKKKIQKNKNLCQKKEFFCLINNIKDSEIDKEKNTEINLNNEEKYKEIREENEKLKKINDKLFSICMNMENIN